jgi:hypothetical protein
MKATILAIFNASWMIWGAYQITKWVARTLETHPRLMEVAICICIACFAGPIISVYIQLVDSRRDDPAEKSGSSHASF